MGNQGFQGEVRAPAQSSIVQERNKAEATISNFNATTQVRDNKSVHFPLPGRSRKTRPVRLVHHRDDPT